MVQRSSDEMRVTFPASSGFSAVARVTATGLALRLGYEVAQVEALRLGVEQAASAFSTAGSITLTARWDDEGLEFELANPDQSVRLEELQGQLLSGPGVSYEVDVPAKTVRLRLSA